MPGCPFLSCFPRYKAYTQVNAVMWDVRGNGNYSPQEPMSAHPRNPTSPNPRSRSQMRQATPTYPSPFVPFGLPPVPPPRRPTPNTHPSYHTFPRSTAPPQLTPVSVAPRAGPLLPALGSPHVPPHHSNHHHAHRQTRQHSHSVLATTPRHVHYADERSPSRSRSTSAQSSRAPGKGQVPGATSYRQLQHTVAQQPTQGHRRRAHSTGNAVVPVKLNSTPSPSRKLVGANGGHQYSKCTGRKKALCIGINYIGQKRELRGCINDIQNVKRFLTRQWGFKNGDIVMLMDQTTNPRQMPTRVNMIDAMKWLVKDAKPHDSLFFHYSGHGGQVADTNGDEVNGLDEVIYPVDYKKSGVIIDDDLFDLMVKPLPRGCRLTAVFDSCHSGTTLDLPFLYHHDGTLKPSHLTDRAIRQKMTPADVVSFAACRDDQTSADTVQGGVAVGAMSYAFLTSLTRNPVQSYLQLLLSVRDIVQPHFQQKAQLSTGHYIDARIQFIL